MVGRRPGRTRPRAGRSGLGKTPANPMAFAAMDGPSPNGPGLPRDAPTSLAPRLPLLAQTAQTSPEPVDQHRHDGACTAVYPQPHARLGESIKYNTTE